MHVRTSVGSGVKHVVQHGIMVHVKPVSDVSQSVRATQIRQVQVKENRRQITISVTWQRYIAALHGSVSADDIYICAVLIPRIQGVLRVNEDYFSA